MTYFSGQIPVCWTLDQLDQLDYFYEEFNDPETMQAWESTYGRIWRTGLQADYRRSQPEFTDKIIQDIQTSALDLDHVGTSYYKMLPGDILPYHQDTYARFIRAFDTDISHIWRVIIFLQDWQPGFLFEIAGEPFTKYVAGTFVAWQGSTAHMAGNLGAVPRYTLQITGVKK
jgi:hypothetical protein